MKRRHAILFGLLLVAAWLAIFGDKTPRGWQTHEIVEGNGKSGDRPPRTPPRAGAASATGARQTSAPEEVAALLPRLPASAEAKSRSAGRELFPVASWTPPPPKPVAAVARPAPPTAPPLPFRYIGRKLEAGRWEAYLERGEQVLIAREGERLAEVYEVRSIAPTMLTLVYLPLQQTQTMAIGGPP